MLKRLGALTVGTLVFVLSLAVYTCAAQIPSVRVQLLSKSTTAMVKVVQGEYRMVNSTTGLPLGTVKPGQICYLGKEGLTLKVSGLSPEVTAPQKGPILLKATGKDLCVFSFNNVNYRGDLTVYNLEEGLLAVNILPVDEYLYGVVGKEMGTSAPQEALKAQALISRSYVLQKRGTALYADVGTDTRTQVYGGYNAEQVSGFNNIKQAVDATVGEVICYQGKIIEAVFHSNAGGYTEASENVWSEALPYLRPVPSPEDAYAQRYSYQDAKGWPGSSYQWQVTLTKEMLEKCIADWNASRPSDAIKIGDIKNILLSRTDRGGQKNTASGRVTELTLAGATGQKIICRDNIRSFFRVEGQPLRSTLITNITLNPGTGEPQGQVPAGTGGSPQIYIVDKNKPSATVPKLFASLTISGKGYGHGLGLSQWGARGMATEQKADYQKIIKHYYTGVEIKKLY